MPANFDTGANRQPEFAYYYPAALWYTNQTSDWIKSLLLFFDGVATLVPWNMTDRIAESDPAVAGHLLEVGLLHPVNTVDALATWRREEEVATRLRGYIEALHDELASEPLEDADDIPHVLSYSKVPFRVRSYLREAGLAKPVLSGGTSDTMVVPRSIWRVVLTALAQFVTEQDTHGLDARLLPTTDQLDCVSFLTTHVATRGPVVAADLGVIDIDVSAVPINELLDFRHQHGEEFRAYRRSLNRYLIQLSHASFDERLVMERDRREELLDIRARLEREARPLRRLIRGASFFLGMTGAGMQMGAGDLLGGAGGMVGAAGALAAAGQGMPQGEYTYLFRAGAHFRSRAH